jgi:hypothetical protein
MLQFIHGKVFLQTGRTLRPAKVIFDAETNSDSINRLSVKSKPKARNRRRALGQNEAAGGSKDNSPVKYTNHSGDAQDEAFEHAGASYLTSKPNMKSSSPKHVRTAKTKTSGTALKGREKANVTNAATTSKTVSHEDIEEEIQCGSAPCNRLNCDEQVALSTKPVALLHSITSDITCSVHGIPTDGNSLPSPAFQDRLITAVTVDSVPNAELHDAGNTIPSLPAITADEPNPLSPATDVISGNQNVSLPEVPCNESGVLPLDTPSVPSSVKDFSTHVSRGRKDVTCDMDTNQLLSNVDKCGRTGEICESVSCKVGKVSREVMQILGCKDVSDMGIGVCDVDVTMSEGGGEVTASEDAKREGEPCTSHQTHCNSDSYSDSWTRKEDKIILQMFQLDCSTEQTFIKISEQLPLRTLNEVSVD